MSYEASKKKTGNKQFFDLCFAVFLVLCELPQSGNKFGFSHELPDLAHLTFLDGSIGFSEIGQCSPITLAANDRHHSDQSMINGSPRQKKPDQISQRQKMSLEKCAAMYKKVPSPLDLVRIFNTPPAQPFLSPPHPATDGANKRKSSSLPTALLLSIDKWDSGT